MQEGSSNGVAEFVEKVQQARETLIRSAVVADRIEQVLDLYLNHHRSVREIQRQIGVSPTETYRILDKAGIQPNASHRGGGVRLFTDSVEQEIAQAYTDGQSMGALSAQYNASRGTIKHVLQRQRVVFRDRGGVKKYYAEEFIQQLVAEWHSGMSQKAIGQKHGLSEAKVYRILKPFPAGTREKIARRQWHPHWKGGRRNHIGYVMVLLEPDDPFYSMVVEGGYVLEHRLVMAKSLGRPLAQHETVHHIDGKRDNNKLDNLQLRQGKHGTGVVYHCADCGSTNVVAEAIAEVSGHAYARCDPLQPVPAWPSVTGTRVGVADSLSDGQHKYALREYTEEDV